MKLLSWNVNGLRACLSKGFLDAMANENPDVIALQETKMLPEQADFELPGYERFWFSAEKKGYSGTAVFTKKTPLSVAYGLGIPCFDCEGRTITIEYPDFYFVTSYSPNSQDELKRIGYREEYEDALRAHLTELDSKKPVILCGDLNVAHQEIDLKNPDQNREHAGFSMAERNKFTALLDCGFVDTFRQLYPEARDAYSWWSYRFQARQRNAGWRIDYFVVSQRLMEYVTDSAILTNILGSDHCPVVLSIKEVV